MNVFQAVAGWIGGFFDKRLWPPISGGRVTTSHEMVSEDSALNYSAVWCATRVLCGTGASLPLPVYRGLQDEHREKARDHAVYRLLNGSPNPEQTAYNFRSVLWQWQVNWGNAYAEIEREGNNPDAAVKYLWPIHPARVTLKRDEDDSLYYVVKNDITREDEELEPWQMFHLPSIITHDGVTGRGVIEHARESIGAGIAAEKFGAHTFVAGVPRVAIEHPGNNWNPEARKAFREEWDEIYGGADRSRVALVQGGAKLVPLNFSAEDQQFLETRQFGVEEIARWYGVPPHLLQHLLRATFNNIEHLGINFVQYSLIPWMRIWEQAVWHKLLTPDERTEYFAEHNVDALMRGDATARSSFYQSMVSAALMTRNEARKFENLDPVEGGDTFLVQGAMVPLDDEGKPESSFAGGGDAAPLPPTIDDEPADDTEDVLATVADKTRRILAKDLRWLLTKESKAVQNYAKKPKEFVRHVDAFYSEHSAFVVDAVSDTLATMTACGVAVNQETFVASWIRDGKSAILEASGNATATELADAVRSVVDSRTWSERPARAVEGTANATANV